MKLGVMLPLCDMPEVGAPDSGSEMGKTVAETAPEQGMEEYGEFGEISNSLRNFMGVGCHFGPIWGQNAGL